MIPRQIQDQLSAYNAHHDKAKNHLAEANRLAKRLLIKRGIELNAIDHDYRWNLLAEKSEYDPSPKCGESPIGVHVYDLIDGTRPSKCIFCGE